MLHSVRIDYSLCLLLFAVPSSLPPPLGDSSGIEAVASLAAAAFARQMPPGRRADKSHAQQSSRAQKITLAAGGDVVYRKFIHSVLSEGREVALFAIIAQNKAQMDGWWRISQAEVEYLVVKLD